MTTRVLPPPAGAGSVTVYGRTYVGVAGASQDVPDSDALMLSGNGWTVVANGGVGTTAQRPTVATTARRGVQYMDTTLGFIIVFDGTTWRNPATGAAA